MMRHLIDCQLDKIHEEERRMQSYVEGYYQEMRSCFQKMYLEFLEKRSYQPQFVEFAAYDVENVKMEKVRECLGRIDPIRFKFVCYEDKENQKNQNQRLSNERMNISSKQLTINDINLESNRSVETKSQRQGKRTIRSRQNSDYRKGATPHNNQSRKTLNLR